MEPKIMELYIEKAYPLRLVQDIMRCIYQFDGRYVLQKPLNRCGLSMALKKFTDTATETLDQQRKCV